MPFAIGDRVMLKPDAAVRLLKRARKKRSTGHIQDILDLNGVTTFRVQRDGKSGFDYYREEDLTPWDANALGMLIAADWLESRAEPEAQAAALLLRREFS